MPKKKSETKKEKGGPASQPKSGVDAWIDKINKSPHFRGKSQVRKASEMMTPYTLRRPTGILSLDIALGGGLHSGGGVQIYGAESAGKTSLAYRAAGELQKNYGVNTNILVFCTEIRMDKGYARKMGMLIAYAEKEIEEFDNIRADKDMPRFTKEEKEDLRKQIGNIVVITSATADVGLDVIVSSLEEGIFQMVIIESLGAFLTKDANEGDVGNRFYGGSSIIITNFQNKIYPLFMMDRPDGSLLETTIVGINQARAKMDASKYERPERPAANAYAWRHGQLASILLEKGASLREEEAGPVVGSKIRWVLTKGKAGTHDGKKGTYNYYHVPPGEPVFWKDVQENWDSAGGVDVMRDAVDVAIGYNIITTSGSWASFGDLKIQGLDNLAMKIDSDPGLREQLWGACINASGLMVRYK